MQQNAIKKRAHLASIALLGGKASKKPDRKTKASTEYLQKFSYDMQHDPKMTAGSLTACKELDREAAVNESRDCVELTDQQNTQVSKKQSDRQNEVTTDNHDKQHRQQPGLAEPIGLRSSQAVKRNRVKRKADSDPPRQSTACDTSASKHQAKLRAPELSLAGTQVQDSDMGDSESECMSTRGPVPLQKCVARDNPPKERAVDLESHMVRQQKLPKLTRLEQMQEASYWSDRVKAKVSQGLDDTSISRSLNSRGISRDFLQEDVPQFCNIKESQAAESGLLLQDFSQELQSENSPISANEIKKLKKGVATAKRIWTNVDDNCNHSPEIRMRAMTQLDKEISQTSPSFDFHKQQVKGSRGYANDALGPSAQMSVLESEDFGILEASPISVADVQNRHWSTDVRFCDIQSKYQN